MAQARNYPVGKYIIYLTLMGWGLGKVYEKEGNIIYFHTWNGGKRFKDDCQYARNWRKYLKDESLIVFDTVEDAFKWRDAQEKLMEKEQSNDN